MSVYHSEYWGMRESKYRLLAEQDITSTDWREVAPGSPQHLFIPRDTTLEAEYDRGWKITDVMMLNGVGMTTARDKIVIDFEAEPILARARFFRDSKLSDEDVCRKLNIPLKKGWNIAKARALIRREKNLSRFVVPVLYRPFDVRLIFYHDSLVWRTVRKIMEHMLAGENIGLVLPRRVETAIPWAHIAVSRHIIEHVPVSLKTIDSLFPLYMYEETVDGKKRDARRRLPNLDSEFIKALVDRLSFRFTEDDCGDLKRTFGPKDVFHYIYAVFHAPTYRTRYAEFLKTDFPRVPLTSDRKLFRALVKKGRDLVALHLLDAEQATALSKPVVRFNQKGSNEVQYVRYVADEKQVWINPEQCFAGFPPEVWHFYVGGYQVCEKWLKDRKKRPLTFEDVTHYQRIVVALQETIRLMAEIDALIPSWPLQ